VLDSLGLARTTLVGSSWGALVALAFAAANPSRVERLVLVDIEPSFTQRDTDVAPRPRSFASADEVVAFERTRNPNAPDDVLAAVAAASVRPGAQGLEPSFDPWFFECWPFRNDDWWDTLREVTAPTLVVHAGQSFVRREITEQMAALLPNGRHVEIATSTHVVPIDAPVDLAHVLLEFMDHDR
jgi:pimeloyl-ACP methyl ester carboxylesterase